MLKVVGWREEGYFWCTDCNKSIRYTEEDIWNNLCRAYGADLQLVPFGQENLPSGLVGDVVVLDENGDTTLEEFKWPTNDVNIVTGRAAMTMNKIHGTHVRVPIPDKGVFGFCIAAIALEDRRRKLENGD